MAFKQHVNFIFHHGKEFTDSEGILKNIGEKSSMKGVERLTEISDLPNEKMLIMYIKEAVRVFEQ